MKKSKLLEVLDRKLKEYRDIIVRERENKRPARATIGKEYFNCRSTREFRAHIRRSTDLSRTAEGLLTFSETKNKSASRGSRWFGNSGGCTGWVDPRMKGCQKPNERCDCTCSQASLSRLLRFLNEIKIRRHDSLARKWKKSLAVAKCFFSFHFFFILNAIF